MNRDANLAGAERFAGNVLKRERFRRSEGLTQNRFHTPTVCARPILLHRAVVIGRLYDGRCSVVNRSERTADARNE